MKQQDKKFQEAFVNIAEEIKAIKAKVQPLNWETNPELKQAAERLGIFDKEPGPIKSTDSYLYNRYLENLRQATETDSYSNIIAVDFVPEDSPINVPPRIRIRD